MWRLFTCPHLLPTAPLRCPFRFDGRIRIQPAFYSDGRKTVPSYRTDAWPGVVAKTNNFFLLNYPVTGAGIDLPQRGTQPVRPTTLLPDA